MVLRSHSVTHIGATPVGTISRSYSIPDLTSYVPRAYRPYYRSAAAYVPYKYWGDSYYSDNYTSGSSYFRTYYPFTWPYYYSSPYTHWRRNHLDYWPCRYWSSYYPSAYHFPHYRPSLYHYY